MATPFISRQDLTDHLGRNVLADDGALIAVDQACDTVRTMTEQTINRGTTTEVFDGTGTDAILLRELPVNGVSAVQVFNGSQVWTTAGTADYTVNGDGMLLATDTAGTSTVGTAWPRGRQNVRVTYDHGWASDDIPRDLRGVALAVAARIHLQGAAIEEASGDQRIKYGLNSTDFSDGERAILRKWRRCR